MAERVFARGHEERLERVIGHMVQNALDATDVEGRVWLKVERLAGQARVEVGDTGHGMTPEFIRDRLFRPFQTTKKPAWASAPTKVSSMCASSAGPFP